MSSLMAVTGADGFIGSHLVEELVRRGHTVRAMVMYNATSSRGWLEAIEGSVMDSVDVMFGDVRDAELVEEFSAGAQVVYHLAALISIPYSYRSPRSYVATNVVGTLNMLEAARRHHTPRLVLTSTSEVYGTARSVPIDESHPLHAQSPYAASKIAADKLGESYHASFDLPVITLRPFNTYGPRQSARAVIPTIITQLAAGDHSLRLGSLDPTRDFMFVQDTVAAFIAAGSSSDPSLLGTVLNACTGVETSVRQLVQHIGGAMGIDALTELEEERLRPVSSEVMRLVGSSDRLHIHTGWRPVHDLQMGLKATVEWFAEPRNAARYNPIGYQI